MDYLLFPTAVSSAEPEGIPPIYSELGEPCSNSFSQSPKQHRVSGARRLTGRLNRPSLEQLPKYLSHGLTKSPGILPMGDSTSNRDQHDPHDPHSHLLLQVTEWLHEEKSKRLSRAPSKGRISRLRSIQPFAVRLRHFRSPRYGFRAAKARKDPSRTCSLYQASLKISG